jgi:hypothetical protein
VLALDSESGGYVIEDPRLMPGDHVELAFQVDHPNGCRRSLPRNYAALGNVFESLPC